jgi:hypothetical protein
MGKSKASSRPTAEATIPLRRMLPSFRFSFRVRFTRASKDVGECVVTLVACIFVAARKGYSAVHGLVKAEGSSIVKRYRIVFASTRLKRSVTRKFSSAPLNLVLPVKCSRTYTYTITRAEYN